MKCCQIYSNSKTCELIGTQFFNSGFFSPTLYCYFRPNKNKIVLVSNSSERRSILTLFLVSVQYSGPETCITFSPGDFKNTDASVTSSVFSSSRWLLFRGRALNENASALWRRQERLEQGNNMAL